MTPIAQNIRVRAVIGKKWLQNVAADVLDPVEQLIIKVFDQLSHILCLIKTPQTMPSSKSKHQNNSHAGKYKVH